MDLNVSFVQSADGVKEMVNTSSKFFFVDGVSERKSQGLVFLYGTGLLILGIIYSFQKGLKNKWREGQRTKSVPQVNKWLSIVPLLDLLHVAWKVQKYGLKVLDEYTIKYGKVFKIKSYAMTHYIVSDPVIIQKLLSLTDLEYLNKPSFFRLLYDTIGIKSSIFTLHGQEWLNRRKLLNRAFTYKAIQSYLGTVNKNSKYMVKSLKGAMVPMKQFPGSGVGLITAEDLFEIENFFTSKTASSIVMGADILSDEEINEFIRNFRNAKDTSVFQLYRPYLMFKVIFRFYKEYKIFNESIEGCLNCILKLTRTYKEEQDKLRADGKLLKFMEDTEVDVGIGLRPHRSMIEELLYAGLGEKEVIDEVVTFMIGGHETTMTAIGCFLMHLAMNPKEQERCHSEIDELFRSKGEESDLTMEEVSGLKHLERCLYEVLRLTTSIPFFNRGMGREWKVNEDLTFEEGSNILVNLWTLHRNPEYFPEPYKFIPDRYLPGNMTSEQKQAYIPFSLGMRNCIAWKMAIVEIKTLMTWVLRNFEVDLVEPLKYEDVNFMYELTIKPDKDIDYILKQRKI